MERFHYCGLLFKKYYDYGKLLDSWEMFPNLEKVKIGKSLDFIKKRLRRNGYQIMECSITFYREKLPWSGIYSWGKYRRKAVTKYCKLGRVFLSVLAICKKIFRGFQNQGWIFLFIPKYCIWEKFPFLWGSGKSFLVFESTH